MTSSSMGCWLNFLPFIHVYSFSVGPSQTNILQLGDYVHSGSWKATEVACFMCLKARPSIYIYYMYIPDIQLNLIVHHIRGTFSICCHEHEKYLIVELASLQQHF